MSTSNDKQYRPVSTIETGQGNPLTVRYVRDLADAANNAKAKVFNHKLISAVWPVDAPLHSRVGGSNPPIDYSSLYVLEQIIVPFAPRYISPGYTKLCVQSIHARLAGTGTTTWRLRAIHKLWGELPDSWGLAKTLSSNYWGSTTLAAQGITYTPEYCEWDSDSSSNIQTCTTFDYEIRDDTNRVWLLLTAENSDADTYSHLYTLDVTPMVGT
jgi:hypothetical protein